MKKLLLYTGALLFGLSGCASAQSGSSTNPQASHNIEQFKEILSGKAYVYAIIDSYDVPTTTNKANAIYLAPDGRNMQCGFIPSTSIIWEYKTYQLNDWRLTEPFFSSGVLFTTNDNKTRSIPVYNENPNVLERWFKYGRATKWHLWFRGHLQDTWPAWALEKCPDLKLPSGLKINYEQKTPDYKQNYEVHELTRAASKVVPVTEDEARTYLFGNNGNILIDSDGQTYVMNGYHSEFWKVNDKQDITDIAIFQALEDRLSIQWAGKDEPQVYRFGDQVQLRPTGERHPAFAFSDWLQQNDIVEIRMPETPGRLRLNFLDHKKVKVYKPDGSQEAIGSWWFEGGQLTLSFTLSEDGNDPKIMAMPWQEAGKQLGYSKAK